MPSTQDVSVTFETKGCKHNDCSRRAGMMDDLCFVHKTIKEAQWLSASDLDVLRLALQDVRPYTEEERRERRVASALKMVQFGATLRSIERARQAGATQEEIDAVLAEEGLLSRS